MSIKRHNHFYPHFLIKNWIKDPWSKKKNKRVKYNKRKDMGETNYYPDELENDLAKVEGDISQIIKSIISEEWTFKISIEEWEKIILYVRIQSIRLTNVSHFITSPDSYFPGNNNFLSGIYTTNNDEGVLNATKYFVDKYLTYTKSENFIKQYLSDDELGIIIWNSEDSVFVATDKAVFKEVDMDGLFLFLLMPISPNKAILITKNKYYASLYKLQNTLNVYNDPRLSMSCDDNFLINHIQDNAIEDLSSKISVPFYEVKKGDVEQIICAMSQDAEQLVFSDEDDETIMKNIRYYNPRRKISES